MDPAQREERGKRGSHLRIAGIYLIAGAAWIVMSDAWLVLTGMETLTGFLASCSKGLLFVAASALLIHQLVKRHLDEIETANALAWSVIDGTDDAVFAKDADGRYLMVNEAAVRTIGRPAAQTLGRGDVELFGPEIAATLQKHDQQVKLQAAGEAFEYELETSAGRKTVLTLKFPFRNASGDVAGVIGIARDITARKQAEEQLQCERDRLAGIVAAVPAVICTLQMSPDGSMAFPFVSMPLSELTGLDLPDEAADARVLFNTIHPDDRPGVEASLADSARTMTPCAAEFRLQGRCGGEAWIEARGVPHQLPSGDVQWHTYLADVTKRHQADEALCETEEHLREARRLAQLGNWSWDCASGKLWWSEPLFELLGLDPATTQPSFECYHQMLSPADQRRAQKKMAALQNGAAKVEQEFRLTRPDGQVIWTRSVSWSTRDASGNVVRVAGFSQDITALKQSVVELETREERLRLALAGSGGGAWDWDLESGLAWWSPEMYEIWGVEPGTAMTWENSAACIRDEDRQRVLEAAEQAIANRSLYRHEFCIHHPRRGTRWILSLGQVVCDEDARPVRMAGISFDATERKQLLEDVKRSEQRLELALSCAQAGAWEWNTRDNTAWWSREMYDLWGVSVSDKPVDFAEALRHVHQGDRDALQRSVEQALERGDAFSAEFRLLHPQRGERWTCSYGRPYLDDASGLQRVLGITFDVTERKRAEDDRRRLERQMLETQRLESLGVMVAGVAHDFNNMLTAVSANLAVAQMRLPDQSPAIEPLNEVAAAAQRAASLTKQLLTYAGGRSSVPKAVRLDRLVKDIVGLLRTVLAKTTTIRLDLEPATIDGDQGQLRQVVMNLMTNASESLNGRLGEVTVRTGVQMLGEDQIAQRIAVGAVAADDLSGGEYAVLTVEDRGCGMTADVCQRILDPFFTTKTTGHGLGLAAVAGIIRSHGGILCIDSQVGRGSTFEIYFRCSQNAVLSEPEPAELFDGATPRQSGEAVIIDENSMLRGYMRRALAESGLDVRTCANWEDAQQSLKEIDRRQLRLVVLGTVGGETNGATLVLPAPIRELVGAIPILRVKDQCAGRPDEVDAASNAVLYKPFTPRELIAAAAKLLRSPEAMAS